MRPDYGSFEIVSICCIQFSKIADGFVFQLQLTGFILNINGVTDSR